MSNSTRNISINSRLDLFSAPAINISNQRCSIQTFDPVHAVNVDAPIIFVIPGDTDYVNLEESFLRFKIKATLANGRDLTDAMDNRIAFVNNIFGSLFKSVKCKLNGHEVAPGDDLYAYKSYIETLFSASLDSEKKLPMQGWHSNTGGLNAVGDTNPAFAVRAAKCNRSRVREYFGRPFLDLFKNRKNILPHVRIELTFFMNPPAFVLQHNNHADVAGQLFKYALSDVQMFIRKETIAPNTFEPIEKRLLAEPAQYFYPISTIKQFHILQGSTSFRADDVFTNNIPVKILATFVRAANFAGSYTTDPFYLNPSTAIESIEFYKNGLKIGHQRSLQVNLAENSSDIYLNYSEILAATGNILPTEGVLFGPDATRQGYFFSAYDLCPDGDDTAAHRYKSEKGNISVYVKFREGLAHGYDLLIYSVFHETMQITAARQVSTTLSV